LGACGDGKTLLPSLSRPASRIHCPWAAGRSGGPPIGGPALRAPKPSPRELSILRSLAKPEA
jgi:hypothetical protein